MNSLIAKELRLIMKYVVRRPTRFAIHPPHKLPIAPPLDRMMAVIAGDWLDTEPISRSTSADQAISQLVTPQPPKTGIVPSAMPISVSRNSGGENKVRIDPVC